MQMYKTSLQISAVCHQIIIHDLLSPFLLVTFLFALVFTSISHFVNQVWAAGGDLRGETGCLPPDVSVSDLLTSDLQQRPHQQPSAARSVQLPATHSHSHQNNPERAANKHNRQLSNQCFYIVWCIPTWGRYRQQINAADSLEKFSSGELMSLITVHPGGESIRGQICVQAQSFKCRLESQQA